MQKIIRGRKACDKHAASNNTASICSLKTKKQHPSALSFSHSLLTHSLSLHSLLTLTLFTLYSHSLPSLSTHSLSLHSLLTLSLFTRYSLSLFTLSSHSSPHLHNALLNIVGRPFSSLLALDPLLALHSYFVAFSPVSITPSHRRFYTLTFSCRL